RVATCSVLLLHQHHHRRGSLLSFQAIVRCQASCPKIPQPTLKGKQGLGGVTSARFWQQLLNPFHWPRDCTIYPN
ncbi:hypothetical protein BGZ52_013032, partial [Haplosporangium bisporale]